MTIRKESKVRANLISTKNMKILDTYNFPLITYLSTFLQFLTHKPTIFNLLGLQYNQICDQGVDPGNQFVLRNMSSCHSQIKKDILLTMSVKRYIT